MLYALWIVASLFVAVWMLGVAGVFAVGSTINVLLVAAVGLVALSLVSRPRTI